MENEQRSELEERALENFENVHSSKSVEMAILFLFNYLNFYYNIHKYIND